MNLSPSSSKRNQDPDVNLTPLIDVVFLLLIFFMVSMTFTRNTEITIQLPEADAEMVETEVIPLEVTIDSQGRFYVNQKLVINTRIETLVKAIKLVVGDNDEITLVISADAQTPYQAVITAMDAARQLNILHMSLATRQKDNSR